MADALVVAEHRHGSVRDVTFEAIAAAAACCSGDVHVVLVADAPDSYVDALSVPPVECIHTYDHAEPFNHDVYCQVLTAVADRLEPAYVVGAHTANGMDLVPALASELERPLLTDVVELEQAEERIETTQDRYGSKLEARISARAPVVLSIRPGEWDEARGDATPTHRPVEIELDEDAIRSVVERLEESTEESVDISDADVLVSVGRGIGEEEHLELAESLADALGATLAASRPIVDAGWLPADRQVGQSGKTVTPDVYIAIGISGAVQHVAGMKNAGTIVAINTDPDAPIFDVADIGIVDDLFDVVPALIDEFTT